MKKQKTSNVQQKTSKVQLFILKNKALALWKNNQLPYYLTTLIDGLKSSDSVDYVRHLMVLTEKFLRVKGYYKKYPDEDKACKDIVLKYLASVGF